MNERFAKNYYLCELKFFNYRSLISAFSRLTAQMKKVIFIIFSMLVCAPVLFAQVGGFGSFSAPDTTATVTPDLESEEEEEEESVLTRMKTRMSFTKRELSKISDPRVRDLYWYALNDTTDRKRYLRAHYAFNEWADNWAFELRGGAQGVSTVGIKERFSLGRQFEAGFKKDLHPYWAIRADGYISRYEHKLYTAHLSTMISNYDDNPNNGSDWWVPIGYSTFGARGAVMLNFVNFHAGREMIYTPWVLYGYAGAGFAYSFKSLSERDGSCLVPQWFFGLQGGWNFNQRYSLVLDANLSWQGDDLQGFTTQASTWKYALTIGLSYKFSKVIHFQRLGYDESFDRKTIVDAVDDGEGDNLQSFIEQGGSRNNKVNNVTKLSSDMIQAAFFQIDRIELQHTYVLNLGFYAELIKKNPEQKFIVKGFADIEVGSMKRNLWLSEQRAKVVADVLVKTYGVNPDQLLVGGGDLDVDIPFLRQQGHHRFNRCTIVCPLNEDYKIIKETEFDDKSELMDGRVSRPSKNY